VEFAFLSTGPVSIISLYSVKLPDHGIAGFAYKVVMGSPFAEIFYFCPKLFGFSALSALYFGLFLPKLLTDLIADSL
jgi:hypothetical protein